MTTRSVRNVLFVSSLSALALGVGARAQDTRDRSETTAKQSTTPATSSTSAASRAAASRPTTGKGQLPDPALLDGSAMPQEKRPEQGMLGDFELPGDDNVRNGKVGGPQQQNPQQGGGGQQQMQGLPQMGGGGGPQQPQQGQ